MQPHTLHKLPFVERFYAYPLLASTNDMARSMVEFPQSGIFVIQADRQTRARGRTGAAYFSDSSGGLWVTILAPIASIGLHFVHNRALALALCEATEAVCGIKNVCSIKWPNDIYWHDKKLCGILLENHPGNALMLVLGFGINITIKSHEFPEALHPVATSILIETGKRYSRSLVLKNILERYHANCAAEPALLHQAYVQRLYGVDHVVEVDGHQGVFEGVEIDGRLRLKSGHELIYLLSGHLRFISDWNNDFDKK